MPEKKKLLSIRTHKCAPAFLREKFEQPLNLLIEALKLSGIENPDLKEAYIKKAFPNFDDLFMASDESLLDSIGPALGVVHESRRSETAQAFLKTAKRLMIFRDVDDAKAAIIPLIKGAIRTMPRNLAALEASGGGRDILDPFIVAFDLHLLSKGSAEHLLRNLLAHKCLMKMEDLIGHMHEEVLGRAAGKQRIPEPEGVVGPDGRKNKEKWHPQKNPYPGADSRSEEREFYQIKNKTGSAKGSDGEKLGRQFRTLAEKYPSSKRYYVSVLGKTLAGHRSMGAFLRTDPQAEVLVGLAAFQQLGGHRDTAEIIMDLYRETFETVAKDLDFDFTKILERIVKEWKLKYGDDDAAYQLLIDMITPDNPASQCSTTYKQGLENSKKG
jgi:hypothetical protein